MSREELGVREIKFRAWSEQGKRMFTSVNNACRVNEQGHLVRLESGIKLMQYTGLKDKNGKEIYEGDIVKPLGCLHDTCDLPVMSVAEVSFWQDGWHLFSSDEKDRLWHYCRSVFDGKEAHHNKVEIIGNIYENTDLTQERE